MKGKRIIDHPSILETVDVFMAAVPLDENRMVLVFRRLHGGRTYIRCRTWNKHRTKRCWYPSKRYYVIPAARAAALAEAFRAAAIGEQRGRKPRWLARFEREPLTLDQAITRLERVRNPMRKVRGITRLLNREYNAKPAKAETTRRRARKYA